MVIAGQSIRVLYSKTLHIICLPYKGHTKSDWRV